MASTNLGKVSVTPKGEYQAGTGYERLDVVACNGGSFMALRDVMGVTPADGADWMQLTKRGETGPQGTKGNQGEPGANAVINGVQTLQIVAGNGLESKQNEGIFTISMFDAPELHRMIFRGKSLGTALTEQQKTSIQNGTFNDLWLGDYWYINGIVWRIVDFDYWYNCGDIAFTKHHLVIMPDDNLIRNKPMNETDTTMGGYVGSLMYTTHMAEVKAICTDAFGENILTHREYLVNAVSNGKPSAGAWVDSTVELPSEYMIYGHPHFVPANDGVSLPYSCTIDKSQLALLAAVPSFISRRKTYWLRDVVSSAYFACVFSYGYTGYTGASFTNIGVRPVFPIGVA